MSRCFACSQENCGYLSECECRCHTRAESGKSLEAKNSSAKNSKNSVLRLKKRIYVHLDFEQKQLARKAINMHYLGTEDCNIMFGGKMIMDPKIPEGISEKIMEANYAMNCSLLDVEIEIELDPSTGKFRVVR